jgi:hypothetical protein
LEKFSRKINSILTNYPLLVLLVVYIVLWLPHVFILNDNLSLVYGFEIDSGTSMDSIINVLKTYNLNGAYSSTYYGWSFYFIVFLIIKLVMFASHVLTHFAKPIASINRLQLSDNPVWLFTSVRFITFLIGMASLVALYALLKKIFKNRLLSFLGCLFYVFPILGYSMFFFIHPETTGLLFLEIAILIYLKMREENRGEIAWRQFYIAIVMLAFSAWAKQMFFFTALPVFIVLTLELARVEQTTVFSFVKSFKFLWTVVSTALIGILILFVIHPFAFFNYRYFLNGQLETFKVHATSDLALSFGAAWIVWLKTISSNLLLTLIILLCLISLVVQVIRQPKNTFGIIFASSSFVLTAIAISNARYFAGSLHYLQPIYPFYAIGAGFAIAALPKLKKSNFIIVTVALGIAFGYSFSLTVKEDLTLSLGRLDYKSSAQYKVYEYINKEIPNGAKLAISHGVIISSEKKFTVFHWWQRKMDDLENFNPDYFVYLPGFSINGKLLDYTIAYNNYVKDHKYKEMIRIGDFDILSRD